MKTMLALLLISYLQNDAQAADYSLANHWKAIQVQHLAAHTWWDSEPRVCRVVNGIPSGVDGRIGADMR